MKVLLISPLPPPAGGIATWTEQYIEWARNNHQTVDIVNTAVVGKRAERINSKLGLISEIIRTKNIIYQLRNKLSLEKPNIVHLNSACGKLGIIRDYVCGRIVKKKQAPLIVHFRCNAEDQIKNKISIYFFKKICSIADQILVLNSSTKEYVRKSANRESVLVANFIDDKYILEKNRKVSPDIRNILYVGHVQESKGSKEIIQAGASLLHVDFILAGPVSDEIAKMQITPNIKLLGTVERTDVLHLLDEADVFLFPTYSEGFSNALLEAMARGLPIITTAVGANMDMIGESGGIIIEAGNVQSILDAITNIKSPDLRNGMSAWNKNKVRSNYTIDKVMKHLTSIYRDLIHESGINK